MERVDLGTKSEIRDEGQSQRKHELNIPEATSMEHQLKTAPRSNLPRTTLDDSITYPWAAPISKLQDKTPAPTHQKEEDAPQ